MLLRSKCMEKQTRKLKNGKLSPVTLQELQQTPQHITSATYFKPYKNISIALEQIDVYFIAIICQLLHPRLILCEAYTTTLPLI